MERTIKRLEALLNEGRTEDVLGDVNDILQQEWKGFSPKHLAELNALRGMAYYRRKDFEDARTDFRFSLGTDPTNEKALYGMAYIAAYADKDPEKTREWIEKLPESAAKDYARTIIMRNKEHLAENGRVETHHEMNAILDKWLKPNPSDSLSVANILHSAGRLYIVFGDTLSEEKSTNYLIPYSWAIGVLSSAIGLYGTGDMNLHHRAAANYWTSVAMEKLFGPAAAVPAACESLQLWYKQLQLDPQNPHYQNSYQGSHEWLLELVYKMGEVISERGPTAGNYDYNLLIAANNTLSITRPNHPRSD